MFQLIDEMFQLICGESLNLMITAKTSPGLGSFFMGSTSMLKNPPLQIACPMVCNRICRPLVRQLAEVWPSSLQMMQRGSKVQLAW
jgi:hypothetical protein